MKYYQPWDNARSHTRVADARQCMLSIDYNNKSHKLDQ